MRTSPHSTANNLSRNFSDRINCCNVIRILEITLTNSEQSHPDEEVSRKTKNLIQFFNSLSRKAKQSHFGKINSWVLNFLIMTDNFVKKSIILATFALFGFGILSAIDMEMTEGVNANLLIEAGETEVFVMNNQGLTMFVYSTVDNYSSLNTSFIAIDSTINLNVEPCTEMECETPGYQYVKNYDDYFLVGMINSEEADGVFYASNNGTESLIIIQGYQSDILHQTIIGDIAYEVTLRLFTTCIFGLMFALLSYFVRDFFIGRLDKIAETRKCPNCSGLGRRNGGFCRSCNGIGTIYYLTSNK